MKKSFMLFFIFFLVVSLAYVSGQDFEVNQPVIKSAVKEGEIINNPVSIINTGKARSFKISQFSEEDFIVITESNFYLQQDESKTIETVLDSSKLNAGVYTGKILIETDTFQEIPVILEVESANALFDSLVDVKAISEEGKREIEAKIKIVNLRSITGEVSLEYYVKNLDGEVLLYDSQSLSVSNQAEITKMYALEATMGEDYIFSAYTREGNSTGTSSALFSFQDEKEPYFSGKSEKYYLIIIFGIVAALALAFVIFNYYWNKKIIDAAKNWNKKIVDLKNVKLGNVSREINNLEYKKKLLKEARARGYITGASYNEGSRKINALIQKLKKRL